MDIKFKNEFAEFERLQEEKALLSKMDFVVDDFNLYSEEVKTVLERVGEDCKVIILGDENTLENNFNNNGINEFLEYEKMYAHYLEIEENRYN